MKKKHIIFLLSLLLMSSSFTSCSKELKKDDNDFDFSLEFNVNGDDKISTFDDSFKSHTVEGVKTIKLVLSDEELNTIKEYIADNEILNENYTHKKSTIVITPEEECTLIVKSDGVESTIKWTSNDIGLFSVDATTGKAIPSKDNEENYEKVMKLFELRKLIEKAIYSHIQTKDLPEHVGYQ